MNNAKIILCSLGLLLMSTNGFAAPAKRGVLSTTQPDGSTVDIILTGDEHYNSATTADGIPLAVDDAGFYRYAEVRNGELVAGKYVASNKDLRSSEVTRYLAGLNYGGLDDSKAMKRSKVLRSGVLDDGNIQTTGELKGLVLLVSFADLDFKIKDPQTEFNRLLNEEGYSDNGATGSVRDYYVDQSFGKFKPSFDVVGPVTLSQKMEYYGSDRPTQDANVVEMIKEACQLAAEQKGVDFSDYDNNKDGKADLVYVIYAGFAQSNGASTNTVWPHMWYLSQENVDLEIGGVKIDRYACSSELLGTSGSTITGIGLFCHEFSHTLGLPDIYSTSGSRSMISMGVWDVMDYGMYNNNMRTPSGYTSYEKSKVGWMTPEELTGSADGVQLPALSESGKAYRLTSPANPNEYYLLENRSASNKWDRYIGGEGMIIIRVNYDADLFNNNQVNSDPSNYRLHLMPANNNYSYSTDVASTPFPGSGNVTLFTDSSAPSSKFPDGTELDKPITNIGFNDGLITFDFNKKLPTPVMGEPTNVTASGFVANWEKVDGAEYYTIVITSASTNESKTYSKIVRNRYTFSRLEQGTYRYRVRAEGNGIHSEYSEEAEIELKEGGIDSAVADGDAVVVVDGRIAVRGSEPATVYALTGQKVADIAAGSSSAPLSAGIYIVVTDGNTYKVAIH